LPNAVAHNTKLSAKLLVLFGYRLTVAGDYGDVKESGWPGSAGEPKFRVMAPAPEPLGLVGCLPVRNAAKISARP